jgi:hypothetical protein
MSESEAYDVAVAYVEKMGGAYHRCFSKRCEADYVMRPGQIGDSDFPRGLRRKVWSFAFVLEEVPPGVIQSGGGCVVFVDDETRICSLCASL